MLDKINFNKKILLVSANIYKVPYPVYPLGLAYISSFFKKKLPDYQIKMFDFNFDTIDSFKTMLESYEPRYIGISLRNVDNVNSLNQMNFIDKYKLIVETAKAYEKSIVVIGGAGYSIFPELLFKKLNPDFGIYGEGELSFKQLIDSIDGNSNFSLNEIPRLVFQENGVVKRNHSDQYFSELNLQIEDETIDYYWQNSGMLNIQTKRGCPYKCIYCSYPVIEGRKIRTLNHENIVTSLERLNKKQKINYVFFTDSVFNIKHDFNRELAERIIKSKLNIEWGAYFAPNILEEKDLALYKKSGLKHIEFGTESLSDTQLVNYGKSFTFNDIKRVSDLCNKLNVNFAHFLILGGYGETDDTLNESFENSKLINKSVFFPFVGMRIYPGTELRDKAIEDKVISPDDNLIEPKYYISNNFDNSTLKSRAYATGRKWVFPDEDLSKGMAYMRRKNVKGPLWEFLIKN